MGLYEMDVFNPYHSQVLLAFIKVLNTMPTSELQYKGTKVYFSKNELRNRIDKLRSDSWGNDQGLITELIETALSLHLLTPKDNKDQKPSYARANAASLLLPMSLQEKICLKNLLHTPYARLFLDDDTITKLLESLKDVPDIDYLQYIDFCGVSPDPEFSDADVAVFRKLLQAVQKKRRVSFDNYAHNGRNYHNTAIPVKIEFSVIHRHFFLSLWNTEEMRPFKVDIKRIRNLEISDPIPDEEYSATVNMMEMRKENAPIVMEIQNERQAIERASLMFSTYQREVTFLDEHTLRLSLYYYGFDKNELIESILSFGPMLRVLEPESIVEEIKEILRQASM